MLSRPMYFKFELQALQNIQDSMETMKVIREILRFHLKPSANEQLAMGEE